MTNYSSHTFPKKEETMTNDHHNTYETYVNSDNTELTINNYIIRAHKNKNNPYYQLNRHAMHNPELSLEAKGLFSYLMSLPDDWVISLTEVQRHSSNGRDAHRKALNELKNFGYVHEEKPRKNGKFEKSLIMVFEQPEFKDEYLKSRKDADSTPAPEKPFVAFSPQTEKPAPVNPQLLNNKYTKYGSIPNDHKKTTTGNIKGNAVSFLTDIGFTKPEASKLLQDYGEQLIRKTMAMEKFKLADNQIGWLKKSLEGRWAENQPAPKPKSVNPDIEATEVVLSNYKKMQQEADRARRNGTSQKHLSALKKNIAVNLTETMLDE